MLAESSTIAGAEGAHQDWNLHTLIARISEGYGGDQTLLNVGAGQDSSG